MYLQILLLLLKILLLLLGTLFAYNLYVNYNKAGRLINQIPGPPGYPFLGNVIEFLGDSEKTFYICRKWNARHYPLYKLWFNVFPVVAILHPNDLEVVLSSPKLTHKGLLYMLLKPWLSNGLLTSLGAKWQKRRKILTPAFHFNILTHFVEIVNEESQNLVKSLKERNNGEPVVEDLQTLISEHTLNLICETAMGISLKGKGQIQNDYRQAVKNIGKIVLYRAQRPWLYPDFIFDLTPMGRQHAQILKILHSFTENIIAERKNYHEKTNRIYLQGLETIEQNGVNSEKTKGIDDDVGDKVLTRKRRLAMLDLLIAASIENEIDDQGIREEVDTFTFEGHDTTSMGLCYILLVLAKHKDIQERVRNEVNSIMLGEDCKLTISAVQGLTYLERCIKEVFRLYPPVPFIARQLSQDCILGNYTVPAGTVLHIHIYDIHRDPAFWPNPLVFDPDRFLPENMKGRHPYSYIPFSAGPRNCIGQRFAMLEMKIIVAFLLHNFALEPVDELDDVRMTTDLVLRPKNQIRVKFIPLHR